MNVFVKGALFIGTSLIALTAEATIYKRVDPENRVVIYTNFRQQIRKVQEAVVAKPPAPEEVPLASPKKVSFQRKAPSVSVSTPFTPTDFPRISTATQKSRDTDRRRILNDELESEKIALNEALAKSAEQDTVHRHKSNIEAIMREIANVR